MLFCISAKSALKLNAAAPQDDGEPDTVTEHELREREEAEAAARAAAADGDGEEEDAKKRRRKKEKTTRCIAVKKMGDCVVS